MNIEGLVYEGIVEIVTAAVAPSPLASAVVHATPFETMAKDKDDFIQIGTCDSHLVPSPGIEDAMEEDVSLILIIASRIAKSATDKTQYAIARDRVIDIAKELAIHFWNDQTMGGRLFDVLPRSLVRDFESIHAGPFAVANLHLLINQTGRTVER